MSFNRSVLLACVCSSLLVGSAGAASVTWNLSGVTFDDGGVATGYLTYDYSTGAVTSFDITTSGGNTNSLPLEHYQNNAAVTNVVIFTGGSGSTNICGFQFDLHTPFTLNFATTAAATPTCAAAIGNSAFNWLPESGVVLLDAPLDSDFGWPNGETANNNQGYTYAWRNIVTGELVSSVPEPSSALLVLPFLQILAGRRKLAVRGTRMSIPGLGRKPARFSMLVSG